VATTGSYDPTTGTTQFTVNASDVALSTGTVIQGFIAGSSQSSDVANIGAGATEVYDGAPDGLAFSGTYTGQANNQCAPLLTVVSHKHHGSAGDFDITLPLTGTPGYETRGTGLTNNSYTLIYTLGGIPSGAGSASVSGTGSATTTLGPGSNQVTVNLTGVSTAQHLTINLTNIPIVNGGTFTNLAVPMDVLVGDVNLNHSVEGNDVSTVQGNTRHAVNSSTFRYDVNANGAIEGNDVSVTQSCTRTSLP
jgi:hypothetical protein